MRSESLIRTLGPAVLAIVVGASAGCAPTHRYGYVAAGGGGERALPEVRAEVVTADRAAASGLSAAPRSIGFGDGADSATLVADFLVDADAARAVMVSDLAIYLRSVRDGQPIECRTEIVPETVSRSQWHPPHTEQIYVDEPVRRQVTTYERRCSTTSRMESKHVTEYERQCKSVSRPVTRTRTVYRSSYDSLSRSYRSMPQTESYTTYESQYECESRPVSRYRTELVPHHECHSEPVTRTITSYEFQVRSQYVPGRLETVTRQRLRELEPVCYAIDAPASAAPGASAPNRIEGTLYRPRTR